MRSARSAVDAPEAGVNIVDLGLVYFIDVTPERVRVELSMTTPVCPLGDLIVDGARRAIGAILPQATALDVEPVWDPP